MSEGPSQLAKLRHDLRSPLNQVIGFCELIMEVVEEDGIAGLDDFLRLIHKAGNDLLTVINEATGGWRVAAGRFDLDALRSAAEPPLRVIADAVEETSAIAQAGGHDQIADDLTKILSAANHLRTQLAQVVWTPEAPVSISSSTTRPFIAESLTGTENGGHLLVVDDDRVNREMMSRRLEHMGFVVDTAEDGQLALTQLAARDYDLVLLDILMPVLDGFQTLEKIRENPVWATLPVIMLTGLDDAESTGRCIAAGAEDYAPKPFNATVLRARITSALEKKQLREREQLYQARIVELEMLLDQTSRAAH